MFSMQSVSNNTLIATCQLSSVASLNLGQSQNGVGNEGMGKVILTMSSSKGEKPGINR